ncbi:MAG: error-prone DNA polymerase [Archangiaceae bacterium]|nr:error-prone DNA polymerase [Archangiaceae bacterium]
MELHRTEEPSVLIRSKPATGAQYVELDVRSNFSFLQSGSSPETLVKHAHALGYRVIGLTDRDGIYGLPRAYEVGRELGVRIVTGCELTLEGPPHPTVRVYVESFEGYQHLCALLTLGHTRRVKGEARAAEEGVPRNCYCELTVEEVCARAGGLWLLADAYELGLHREGTLRQLRDAFGPRFSLRMLRQHDGFDAARERAAVGAARELEAPILATNAVRYAVREDKQLFDVAHCIREGVTLEQAGRALSCNAEGFLKAEAQMVALFSDRPRWLERSVEVAEACRFELSQLKYSFPSEIEALGPKEERPFDTLTRLVRQGIPERYPEGLPPHVRELIDKELKLIDQLDVAPFFLSVYAIVRIARERDILCQGRGSAANSAVCYVLGITAVDPARSATLFERFMSPERKEPPDIDVDFEHARREEVIQEIYRRYGRDRAAMVSEVICYRGRSAMREVAKVFGYTLEEANKLSGLLHWWNEVDDVRDQRFAEAGFQPDARLTQVVKIAARLQGFPRHLSIHVGGFVLSARPLTEVAPVEPATMPGRTVIPWNKDDLDVLGFFKVDVLALGMLTAIRKCLDLAQHDERLRADGAIARLAKVPPEDPRAYDAACAADTVGVFQIESRAQMAMLPRLKPRRFYDIVVQVAIVRPGPIQGGMVHPYLRRRMGQEKIELPHPSLAPILERTFGVPIFQEQAMQIAIVGAGYSGGEADQLRRDMAAWRRNGKLEGHRDKLIAGFRRHGISEKFAQALFRQIQGFGEYGFPESHAASFGLLAYASLWLKVHHPAEFAAALINSQPMGFYSPNTILQDAKRHGIELLPVCVHHSGWDCSVPQRHQLRVGLRLVRGLREATVRRIEQLKPFASIDDLAARTHAGTRDLTLLAQSGALDVLEPDRRQAIWLARVPRLDGLLQGADAPTQRAKFKKLTRLEQLKLDFGTTGVSVNDHPMKLWRSRLPPHVKSSAQVNAARNAEKVSAAGMVIVRQRPGTAKGIVFMTLEDEFGFTNLVFYQEVFERLFKLATGVQMLVVHGTLQRAGDTVHVMVESLEPLAEARFAPSHDFH